MKQFVLLISLLLLPSCTLSQNALDQAAVAVEQTGQVFGLVARYCELSHDDPLRAVLLDLITAQRPDLPENGLCLD